MAEFTKDGLSTKTLAEIKEDMETDQKSDISPSLDLSTTSPAGQFNSIFADAVSQNEEALAGIYRNMDPSTAEGDALDRISAFTGTFRRAATKTSVSCSLFFSQTGTYASGTLLAYPSGSDGVLFENVSDVVISSVPATASNVLMRAVNSGVTQIILGSSGSGTLTKISSPVAGWDGLFGSSSLSIGTGAETDAELAVRRVTELFKAGSTSVNGIISELSNTYPGINSVSVTTNTGTVDDAAGLPAGAIEIVVWAPSVSSPNIASTIFDSVAAHTMTWGNTFELVADSFGNQHEVWFTRPTEEPISLEVTLQYAEGQDYGGDDFVKQTIISNATGSFTPGLNVAPSKISSWVQPLDGVLWVTQVLVNGVDAIYDISRNQIATITSSNDITINSSVGTP